MKGLYLVIDLGSVIIPFLFSFHPKLKFHKEWRYFIPALLIGASAFILWDMYFTRENVWGFNEKYLTGIFIGNLPIEEILFFICIPYACVFTYHCLNLFFDFSWPKNSERNFTLLFILGLTLTGFLHFSKMYSATTFLSLAILLTIIRFVFKFNGLSKIYSVYFFLLIPFLIVNGILTGTGLEEPIVGYDNSENLSLRVLTIPIEDIFYGFEFFLLITFLYLTIKNRIISNETN